MSDGSHVAEERASDGHQCAPPQLGLSFFTGRQGGWGKDRGGLPQPWLSFNSVTCSSHLSSVAQQNEARPCLLLLSAPLTSEGSLKIELCAGEVGNGEQVYRIYGVFFWGDENAQRLGRGHSHTTL